MERIVVADDGTAASLSARDWAAARARLGAATVNVVSVTAAAVSVDDVGVRGDLLVVGVDHGQSIRAAVAGAASLRTGEVPVVVVPGGWVDAGRPITVGIADDDSSSGALAFAAGEARSKGVPIRLVHAWLMATPSFARAASEASPPPAPTPLEAMEQHRRVLDEAVRWVAGRYPSLDVQAELVRDSRSAALLRFGSRSSLLAVGAHLRGPFADHLLRAVAQGVAWQVDCPIALVPVTPVRA